MNANPLSGMLSWKHMGFSLPICSRQLELAFYLQEYPKHENIEMCFDWENILGVVQGEVVYEY